MRTGFIRVVENTRLYGSTYIMWLDPTVIGDEELPGTARAGFNADLLSGAAPGHFLMMRTADFVAGAESPPTAADLADDPLLPRAMSYHRVRDGANGQEFSILYDVVGRGT